LVSVEVGFVNFGPRHLAHWAALSCDWASQIDAALSTALE